MQRLNPQRCALLTQVISSHYPNQQILHLTDGCNDLHRTLYDFTKTKNFEYDLRTVGCEIGDLDASCHAGFRLEPLDLSARRFNRHAKLYENIFVTLSAQTLERDIQTVLKKFFRVMKNAGVLTLMIERDSPLLERIDRELEECYFVAISHIDIFDDYDVVTSRKMHGWGAYNVGF
ncbi:hypothetical protein [Hydrogenimonas urashimensis]|uniref:hypothetical protein n=1 Tax=Hydrogenimonas urashimensis TaxID=2740515 RepID=UPI0019163EBB|nr:hypothetical protein [Hydrogenimonas urashimensis]